MKEKVKRSKKFLEAYQTLPPSCRVAFVQLADDYQFAAHVGGGFPWVAYGIIAELVKVGWRRSAEPSQLEDSDASV